MTTAMLKKSDATERRFISMHLHFLTFRVLTLLVIFQKVNIFKNFLEYWDLERCQKSLENLNRTISIASLQRALEKIKKRKKKEGKVQET